MRIAVLIALSLACVYASDHVTVKMRDGRSINGYYDAEQGTITIKKPPAVLYVKTSDVESVTPCPEVETQASSHGGIPAADRVDYAHLLKLRSGPLRDQVDSANTAYWEYLNKCKSAIAPNTFPLIKERAAMAKKHKEEMAALDDKIKSAFSEVAASLKPTPDLKLSNDPTRSEIAKSDRAQFYNELLMKIKSIAEGSGSQSAAAVLNDPEAIELIMEFGHP